MKIPTDGFVAPFYEEKGKRRRSLSKYFKKAGVYIIKEDGIVVYVGMSGSCVVEACYRHFYRWRDCYRGMGREYRTTYFDMLTERQYSIAILELDEKQVAEFEKAMIVALRPRDNREKYDYYFEQLTYKQPEPETNIYNSNTETDDTGDDLPF